VSDISLYQRVLAAHRCFPSGVAVVTTERGGRPYGLAVNAFSSVSMEPPLVLVCVKTSTRTHPHLYAGDRMGINILSAEQRSVAERFAVSGGDKFAEVSWHPGVLGVPVLDRASAVFEALVQERHAAGTHTIFLGQVQHAEASARRPLVYCDGSFFDGARLWNKEPGDG
jgi:flavin reductase (DIM6/NTAB) family NADH-FMN oxidoreductase RutF